ncbi:MULTISPECIES: hypothetical protein [Trichocoleus]|uniref:DUF2157 domain-containing protein n=1 Tax=Trichocoleus desertorum GB2-A4 TaxID=2933944 RepID=A0ABV0JEE0_9CYAN|nr:hypothetical protein [Trichocoleus sp. FACHB-46]MBD1864938.1 hypothetical protein [Trichocoleus sp. FACHB-46]
MNERLIRRYRNWYAKPLRLYSKPYYERFGEGMKQAFTDLLRERAEEGRGLFGYALWLFIETSAGIIRENITSIVRQNKNIIYLALGTAFILLMPLIAMLFTNQVVWDLTDFIVAGTLIFGTGLAYELVARKGGTMAYRVAVGIALAAAFLLVWMNLAVGIIGSEDNPINLMYFGVVTIGILGATIARLRPRGMARTLFATALAQALVPAIALMIKKPQVTSVEASMGVLGVLGLNAFFVMMFIGSALLFRRSRIRL